MSDRWRRWIAAPSAVPRHKAVRPWKLPRVPTVVIAPPAWRTTMSRAGSSLPASGIRVRCPSSRRAASCASGSILARRRPLRVITPASARWRYARLALTRSCVARARGRGCSGARRPGERAGVHASGDRLGDVQVPRHGGDSTSADRWCLRREGSVACRADLQHYRRDHRGSTSSAECLEIRAFAAGERRVSSPASPAS